MGVKERRQREKEWRSRQIMDAARELFTRKGYFDVRMDEIAARAEVAIGTLYLYFPSKDEIYAMLCEEGLDILNRLIEEAVQEEGGSQGSLEAIGRSYLRFYEEFGSYYDVLSFVGMGFKQIGLSGELEKRITEKSDAAISKLERVVKEGMEAGEIEGGNSHEVAFFLWGLLEGLIFIHRRGYMDAWSVDLAGTSAQAMNAIYRGISSARGG